MILAAGQGKRMQSQLPKVLHELAGEPMLFHILRRVRETEAGVPVAIVVGHGREQVEAAVRAAPEHASMDLTFIHQAEQRGTGHAARCAMDSAWGDARLREKAEILILPGDLPLIPQRLVVELLAPLGKSDVMRLLTTELTDPTGYGRVVRRGKRGPCSQDRRGKRRESRAEADR